MDILAPILLVILGIILGFIIGCPSANTSTNESTPANTFIPARRIMLSQWRKTPERVDAAREIAKTPIFQEMLCAVENSRPEGFLPGVAVTEIQAVRELGRIEGYGECLQNIRFLCSDPKELQTMPEPDYGAGDRPK